MYAARYKLHPAMWYGEREQEKDGNISKQLCCIVKICTFYAYSLRCDCNVIVAFCLHPIKMYANMFIKIWLPKGAYGHGTLISLFVCLFVGLFVMFYIWIRVCVCVCVPIWFKLESNSVCACKFCTLLNAMNVYATNGKNYGDCLWEWWKLFIKLGVSPIQPCCVCNFHCFNTARARLLARYFHFGMPLLLIRSILFRTSHFTLDYSNA